MSALNSLNLHDSQDGVDLRELQILGIVTVIPDDNFDGKKYPD